MAKISERMVRMTITVPLELKVAAQKMARSKGISLAAFCREALVNVVHEARQKEFAESLRLHSDLIEQVGKEWECTIGDGLDDLDA